MCFAAESVFVFSSFVKMNNNGERPSPALIAFLIDAFKSRDEEWLSLDQLLGIINSDHSAASLMSGSTGGTVSMARLRLFLRKEDTLFAVDQRVDKGEWVKLLMPPPPAATAPPREGPSDELEERATLCVLSILRAAGCGDTRGYPVERLQLNFENVCATTKDIEMVKYVGQFAASWIADRSHLFTIDDNLVYVKPRELYAAILFLNQRIYRRPNHRCTLIDVTRQFDTSPQITPAVRSLIGAHFTRFVDWLVLHPWIFTLSDSAVESRRSLLDVDWSKLDGYRLPVVVEVLRGGVKTLAGDFHVGGARGAAAVVNGGAADDGKKKTKKKKTAEPQAERGVTPRLPPPKLATPAPAPVYLPAPPGLPYPQQMTPLTVNGHVTPPVRDETIDDDELEALLTRLTGGGCAAVRQPPVTQNGLLSGAPPAAVIQNGGAGGADVCPTCRQRPKRAQTDVAVQTAMDAADLAFRVLNCTLGRRDRAEDWTNSANNAFLLVARERGEL